ncbi:hypothetical protein PC116_g32235 [Phytophthora cactorum]|nr:hypothetical protein PC116_g32235 [Phytophthora cactorum]
MFRPRTDSSGKTSSSMFPNSGGEEGPSSSSVGGL